MFGKLSVVWLLCVQSLKQDVRSACNNPCHNTTMPLTMFNVLSQPNGAFTLPDTDTDTDSDTDTDKNLFNLVQ